MAPNTLKCTPIMYGFSRCDQRYWPVCFSSFRWISLVTVQVWRAESAIIHH